jgi:hypothetical protein
MRGQPAVRVGAGELWQLFGVCATSGSPARARLLGALVVCLVAAGCEGGSAAPAASSRARSAREPTGSSEGGYPDSIVALGHSGVTGYDSDPSRPEADATANSWITGTNPAVDSLYQRILARNPRINGHNTNLGQGWVNGRCTARPSAGSSLADAGAATGRDRDSRQRHSLRRVRPAQLPPRSVRRSRWR